MQRIPCTAQQQVNLQTSKGLLFWPSMTDVFFTNHSTKHHIMWQGCVNRSWSKCQRGSIKAQIGSLQGLQSPIKALPNPIYPSHVIHIHGHKRAADWHAPHSTAFGCSNPAARGAGLLLADLSGQEAGNQGSVSWKCKCNRDGTTGDCEPGKQGKDLVADLESRKESTQIHSQTSTFQLKDMQKEGYRFSCWASTPADEGSSCSCALPGTDKYNRYFPLES